jgi:uncharacterized protein (TIGR01370 family)
MTERENIMKKRRYQRIVCLFIILVWLGGGFRQLNAAEAAGADYGVYIGNDDMKKICQKAADKTVVVIEGQNFSAGQIAKLKADGKKVYSYLNVGSVETYRSYYRRFEKYTLSQYENWWDEYWIDVSKKSWQKFIAGKVAGKLAQKGIDGFFVDNCDVYYHYKTKKTYQGLTAILQTLRKYDKDIIINGGDVFVSKLIKDKKTELIDGVNQECVFSRIEDYDRDRFKKQEKSEVKYFQSYLKKVKKSGLKIFLLEYTKDRKLKKKIADYCDRKEYGYYISESVKLY